MIDDRNGIGSRGNRRSFLKNGLAAAGAATLGTGGTGLLTRGTPVFAQEASLTAGDAAILRFLASGEALEADFWTQYNELGGIQDDEVPGGSDSRIYKQRLKRIDPIRQ